MKFTTQNKYKANKENEVADMLSEIFTVLTVRGIHEKAMEDLENSPECLEKMVKKAVAENFSVEDAIILGFAHGYKHAVVESLTEEDE
ncbi:hypothetical protein [Lactococcus lactis]|uniref:Phage protein n=1 Tax=Lactococcus lactis TaxID=1358 RepID=A0AAW5TQJ4_9LACT|nr:hypothetical protein [Lactococcus lactis]MCW2280436.1 hypothetical protein [Lactococcus lactis]MCW2281469.1 hypothetical protein [Lactococcus lactis]